MMPDDAIREIFQSFSADEQKSFMYEVDRRLSKFVGRKNSHARQREMAKIIAEEVEMILVARDG